MSAVCDPLQKVLSYLDRPERGSSQMMVLANQNHFSEKDYAQAPYLKEVEADARAVGELIGKQEVVRDEDVEVLIEIVMNIAQMAYDRELVKIEGKSEDNPDFDATKFFDNSLELTKVCILQPIVNMMKEFDVNTNVQDFQRTCSKAMEYWKMIADGIGEVCGEAYQGACARLEKFFEGLFPRQAQVSAEPN